MTLDALNDPWSLATYLTGLAPKAAILASLRDTYSGACWLLGNGPSLRSIADAINASRLPKIGTNKALGLVWPLDAAVLCHTEHLDAAIPPYCTADASAIRWKDLEERNRLFLHGTSSPRGIPIPISHHALFSTDLALGATEGTPATGGSVLLVAMQLAYHLGFRTFLLAGNELAGMKFYEGGPFNEDALDGQRRLFRLVRPHLDALGIVAYLVSPGDACRNDAFAQISFREAEEIAAHGT